MRPAWNGLRRIAAAFALLVGLAMLSACSQTMGSSTAALTVRPEDIAKQEKPGGPVTVGIGGGLAIDVYPLQPEAPKPVFAAATPTQKAPVLLYVHGGGWVKGDRSKVYSLPAYARSRGYVLVSVQYRPRPRNSIDGQVADVVKGIEWTRANIAAYGGDPGRIVIMGHSAGSHLVALVGAKKAGGPLRGVVANDEQAYDLPAYYTLRNNSMHPIYVKAFGTNRADWVRHSPVTYVRKGSGFPPFLILHSGSDGPRRKALAESFAAELRAKGGRAVLFDGRAYTHGSIASKIGRSGPVTRALDAFLQSVYR